MKNLKPGSIWYSTVTDTIFVIFEVHADLNFITFIYGDRPEQCSASIIDGWFKDSCFFIGDL
jgi:hypothetical protein